MIEEEIAWAAGLFEGEGCIQCKLYKRPDRDRVDLRRGLSLTSTDLDVIEHFQAVVGVGKVYGPKLRPGRKPSWRWTCSGWNDTATLLVAMLPYLGERRAAKARVYLQNSPASRRKAPRLTDEDVREIRKLAKTPMKRGEIAKQFGVSQSYLSNIVKGIVRVRPLYGREFV